MYRIAAFLLPLLPAAAADAQILWEYQGSRVETARYSCSSAIDDLSVAYFTAPDGTSFAAAHFSGQVHAMVQDVSGSGVRYVDIDEQSGYRIHAEGETLLLMKLDASDSAEEEVLSECTEQKG